MPYHLPIVGDPPGTPAALFFPAAVRAGGAAAREALGAAREAVLAERHAAGGLATARGLAAATDALVRAFVEHHAPRPRGFAVLAVGGYGRGELCPSSDWDLVVLARRRSTDVQALAGSLGALLWDAGGTVNLTLRTPRGAREAMDRDHTLASTLHDHRFLAGDPGVGAVLTAETLPAFLRERGGEFVRAKAEEARLRRARFGGTPAGLEPDVKESPGGLRDVHAVRWLTALRPPGPDGGALEGALDTILRFRIEMHLLAGRKQDILDLGTQMELVRRWGEQAESESEVQKEAQEHIRVMSSWFRAAKEAGRACDRALGCDPVPEGLPRTTEGLRALLSSSGPAAPALRALHGEGSLASLLPEFEAQVALPQADPYHAWTVDEHVLRALEALDGILRGRGPEGLRLSREAAALPSPLVLRLALLLHDAGKVRGSRGHAARSVELVRGAPERLGLSPAEAREVLRLVETHTALGEASALAVHGDEAPVRFAAEAAGSPEGLRLLLLHTAADIAGVGRGAWTGWRAAQLLEFHGRVEAVLRGLPAFPPDLGGALREALPPGRWPEVADLLRRAPFLYASTVEPRRARMHLDLLRRRSRRGAPAVAAAEERPGALDLLVAAGDRPHLFADLAGALTLEGLDILSADAHTLEGGVALDSFTVRLPVPSRRGALRALEEAAAAPPASLAPRVRRFASRIPAAARPPGRGGVEVRRVDSGDGSAAGFRVECPDRPGLLHDLARALADAGCDLHQVRVATLGPRALDAFRVTRGGRPPDPGPASESLLASLRAACAPPREDGWA